MIEDPDDDDIVEPWRAGRSGAFVVRIWRTDDGVRARVRATLDLADPDAVDVRDVRGPAEAVNPQIGELLRRWLAEFTGDATVTPP